MPVTLNASNSGTGGLLVTSDATGNLAFQTAGNTAIAVDTSQNATFANTATFTGNINAPNTFGFKNRIINGAMVIDQRNAGASVTPANGTYTLDRWQAYQSTASKYSLQQNAGSITPPVGFSNYLGVTSLSAYSVASGDYYLIQQRIEGFNFSDMAWGTANAKTVTLSFQVYSSLTGTFGGSLVNNANNRSYPFSYSISTANTWTSVSVTIAGDTTGTWVGGTNGIGVNLNFGLGVGSTLSGTAGAWAGANYLSVTGATSVVGTNGATFYITGVQLEKGSTATSFDYRSFGNELIMCQRYYEKSYQYAYAVGSSGTGNTGQILYIGTGNTVGAGDKIPNTTFKVVKRTAPDILVWSPNGTSNRLANMSGTDLAAGSCTPNVANDSSFFAYQNSGGSVSGTAGCVQFQWSASAEL
jgi:hypothetical protein